MGMELAHWVGGGGARKISASPTFTPPIGYDDSAETRLERHRIPLPLRRRLHQTTRNEAQRLARLPVVESCSPLQAPWRPAHCSQLRNAVPVAYQVRFLERFGSVACCGTNTWA